MLADPFVIVLDVFVSYAFPSSDNNSTTNTESTTLIRTKQLLKISEGVNKEHLQTFSLQTNKSDL